MMKIGLIGSGSFYNTFKQEFSKHQQIYIFNECSTDAALQYSTTFENILITCQYLFFEKIDSTNFQLVNAGLKNGKHIVINDADISMEEMHEMYNISNEGNLKCMIFHPENYYKIFKPLKDKIKSPFLIEISSAYPAALQRSLTEGITHTMNTCVQNLLYLSKSDIKQISVKQSKIFSDSTDFISVQLDFSNGCNALIKLSAFESTASHSVKVYQPGAIFDINLADNTVAITEQQNNELLVSNVTVPQVNITEKKVQYFLTHDHDNQTPTHSILDNYLLLELSGKILKKINSLND